jgi:hypothetical protein
LCDRARGVQRRLELEGSVIAGPRRSGRRRRYRAAGRAGADFEAYIPAAGYDALFVDRAWFPRDNVCGDFVRPLALEKRGGEPLRRTGAPASSRLRRTGTRSRARSTSSGASLSAPRSWVSTTSNGRCSCGRWRRSKRTSHERRQSGEAILLQYGFDRCSVVDRDGDCTATVGAVDAGAGVVERADRRRCRVAEQVVAPLWREACYRRAAIRRRPCRI